MLIIRRFSVIKVLEIKAAEGGKDAKLFVQDLSKAYLKMFDRFG